MPETISSEPIVEHAGTGFRIPESTARQIDELSKGLPAECKYTRFAKTAEYEIDGDERTEVSFVTTDDIDRDREVILPDGLDTKDYNGVVTFCHKYDQLPVGRSLWIKPKMKGQRNGLIAKTYYPTKPKDWGDAPWLPSAILHLMQSPHPTCTGKSIGFIPMEVREATAEEKARRPELKGVPIISRARIIEYAVTGVPANPAAEMELVAKSIKAMTDRALAKEVAEAFNISEEALAAAPAAEIEKTAEQVAAEKAADREARIAQLLATPDSFITAEDYLAAQRRAAVEQARQHAQAFLTMRSGRV